MKHSIISFALLVYSLSVFSQGLPEARELYLKGEYKKALPLFELEYKAKPADANINQWYGVCLFETGGNLAKAKECLLIASKKEIQDSFLYLGIIYASDFRFIDAKAAFGKYEELLTKKNPKKKKEELAKDQKSLIRLEEERKTLSRWERFVYNTEDIQLIDSVVVDKSTFLSAYSLSLSSGRIENFNTVFTSNKNVESTVYFNEKGTKIYYAQPDSSGIYTLYSMEKLLKDYGNEKRLSATNFGLEASINYPFLLSDGLTIYFAAKDADSLGGYDLFVSRYNMNNDTYLKPERMNMPFNSRSNDYMLVIDEEKGIGWFASDRFQPPGKVCIYTFIPNGSVTILESSDEQYIVRRANIVSIKDSWKKGYSYEKERMMARTKIAEEKKVIHDFEFVLNDANTYYTLTDFKNKIARDTYFTVIQKKSELATLQKELDENRIAYSNASASDKRSMTNTILSREQKGEVLQKEIPELELQARKQEIGNDK